MPFLEFLLLRQAKKQGIPAGAVNDSRLYFRLEVPPIPIVGFPSVPIYSPDEARHRRDMAAVINRMNTGKINALLDVTLKADAAVTTISDARLSSQTGCLFMPRTANASAELGAGTIYVLDAERVNGSVVITHANNAQTDRDYYMAIIG